MLRLFAGLFLGPILATTAWAQEDGLSVPGVASIGGRGLNVPAACSDPVLGVCPTVRMDFVHSLFSHPLTIDTCTKTAGVPTCTGSQVEATNAPIPAGNVLYVIDSCYPLAGQGNTGTAIAFYDTAGNAVPVTYAVDGAISAQGDTASGGIASTGRTGCVKIAVYWDGTIWAVSFAGDTVQTAGHLAPTASTHELDMGGASAAASYVLTAAFHSLKVYPVTLTSDAQLQAVAAS